MSPIFERAVVDRVPSDSFVCNSYLWFTVLSKTAERNRIDTYLKNQSLSKLSFDVSAICSSEVSVSERNDVSAPSSLFLPLLCTASLFSPVSPGACAYVPLGKQMDYQGDPNSGCNRRQDWIGSLDAVCTQLQQQSTKYSRVEVTLVSLS